VPPVPRRRFSTGPAQGGLKGGPNEVVAAGALDEVCDVATDARVDLDDAWAGRGQFELDVGGAVPHAERRECGAGEVECLPSGRLVERRRDDVAGLA
jgi:hypothetical protein